MPSVLLTESMAAGMAVTEPWPEDVRLYQPYEVEQILLPDSANCLSVKAFLRMCQLNFQVEMRTNAENMSPSGHVPFIRCGMLIIADFEPVVSLVKNKGISLSDHLDNSERADMKAYISLVNMVLQNAELYFNKLPNASLETEMPGLAKKLYVSWCDRTTLMEVTKPRFISALPWPVNHIICLQKKWSVLKKLKSVDWQNKTLGSVYEEVNNCCHALSERLGKQKFFFGDKPTELDAVVFGHLFAILTTPLPDNRLSATVREYQNLLDLCRRIDVQYFQKRAEEEEIEEIVMES